MVTASRVRARPRVSALRRWYQTWQLMLRLARRDIRSHAGRSALVMVMVGVPVLLISSILTWTATSEVTPVEAMPASMGTAQAKIEPWAGSPVEQLPVQPQAAVSQNADPVPLPGQSPGEQPTTAQLQQLTGGRVVEVGYPTLFATSTARPALLSTLSLPADLLPVSGLATLTSGRWPAAPGETLVTATGIARGLPTAGLVVVRSSADPELHDLEVVGVAAARDASGSPVALVTGADVQRWAPAESWQQSLLLFRDQAVFWPEVQQLNRHGYALLSRAVVENPPPAREVSPQAAGRTLAEDDGVWAVIGVLVVAGLLLQTTLMAGPAFAVSAARSRRSLALLASNGADRRQLRRYLLAQALILGAAAALLGALLGVGGGAVLVLFDHRTDVQPTSQLALFDVPWGWLAPLVLAATVASVTAALLPSRGLSRLRIADVLTGRGRTAMLTVGTSVLGVTVAGLAAAALIAKLVLLPRLDLTLPLVPVVLVVVVGWMWLIPPTLDLLGRLAGRLPLLLRIPVRDAARQRTRYVPAIAAISMTVATLTVLLVTDASINERGVRDYTTSREAGHGYIGAGTNSAAAEATLATIRSQHPDWRVSTLGSLGSDERREGSGRSLVVAAVPRRCTPVQAVQPEETETLTPDADRCARLGSNGQTSIDTVFPASAVEARLPGDARAVLAAGGLITTDQRTLDNGEVTLAVGSYAQPDGGSRRVDREVVLPGLLVTTDQMYRAYRLNPDDPTTTVPGALISTTTVASLNLPATVTAYEIVDPTGPISTTDEQAINSEALTEFSVERGHVNTSGPAIWLAIVLAVSLTLIATLVATALAQAESHQELRTLAAVGATTATRRWIAAGQAVLIAGTGVLLGLAAGTLSGAALSQAFTLGGGSTGADPAPIITIPWAQLLTLTLSTPLVAAVTCALGVRKLPTLTRRAD